MHLRRKSVYLPEGCHQITATVGGKPHGYGQWKQGMTTAVPQALPAALLNRVRGVMMLWGSNDAAMKCLHKKFGRLWRACRIGD